MISIIFITVAHTQLPLSLTSDTMVIKCGVLIFTALSIREREGEAPRPKFSENINILSEGRQLDPPAVRRGEIVRA